MGCKLNKSVNNHKAKTILDGYRYFMSIFGLMLHKLSLKLLSFQLKESSIYFDEVDGINIIKHKVFDEINEYNIIDFITSRNIYALDKDQLINIIRYILLNEPHDNCQVFLKKSNSPDHFMVVANGISENSHWLEIISNKHIFAKLDNNDYITILNAMKRQLKVNPNISPKLRVIK